MRVQNEQFFGGKGIQCTLYWKGGIVAAGIRTLDTWITAKLSTAELSDLLMNGHKRIVCQVPNNLFTNELSVRNCHKITNCERFRTKCCVKIAATLTLASTEVFLTKNKKYDKNVTKRGNPEGSKNIFFVGKWVESLWRQVIIIKNRRSLLYQ